MQKAPLFESPFVHAIKKQDAFIFAGRGETWQNHVQINFTGLNASGLKYCNGNGKKTMHNSQ